MKGEESHSGSHAAQWAMTGGGSTVRDLAKAEAINESYLGRILRLTLLSPTIIEAILEGRQLAAFELDDLLRQLPIEWDQQLGTLTESR